MCTGFVRKGKDLIYGFNLDIDPNIWSFDIYKTKKYFTIGITVGSTTYFTHGVNANGNFGNLPYMNGVQQNYRKGIKKQRIDLLNDKYIRGKYNYNDVLDIVNTKTLINIPNANMHSLICDADGNVVLLEPGYGNKIVKSKYAVISNFPILTKLDDYSNPFFGKDRYDIATQVLKESKSSFSVNDALDLLNKCKQEGKWGTKVSFVYSKNNNTVYYCLNGDFKKVLQHKFE